MNTTTQRGGRVYSVQHSPPLFESVNGIPTLCLVRKTSLELFHPAFTSCITCRKPFDVLRTANNTPRWQYDTSYDV